MIGLRSRLAVALLVFGLCLVYALPSVPYIGTALENVLPSKKINLGLDLKGGIHLTLGVDVAKAVSNSLALAGQDIRRLFPEADRFSIEGADVIMKHIGGYPGKYDPSIRGTLLVRPPKLFISGHSHILKVKYDKTLRMLHINPGAAGKYGFHKVRTLVRFSIENGAFSDLEVIELSD